MNLTRLLTHEELVAGLEISDTYLRLAILEIQKTSGAMDATTLIDEPIPTGIIVNGIVKDATGLQNALQSLLKRAKRKIHYAVVSLPSDTTYTKIFSFPKALEEEKINESMRLTAGYQLPLKQEDVYIDWETLSSSHPDKKEVALAAMPKTVVDKYLEALDKAGLKPVAMEYHILSLARVTPKEKSSTLVVLSGATSTTLAIIEDGIARFMRIVPEQFGGRKTLPEETRKIAHFYEVESGESPKILEVGGIPLVGSFTRETVEKTHGGNWLVVIGAAVRGMLPRSEDAINSLMPMGTERAYEYQKAIVFSDFFVNLVVGLSIFFVVSYGATWSIMVTLQRNAMGEFARISTLPIPADAAILEARAQKLNEALTVSSDIIRRFPRWEIMLEYVKRSMRPGIVISQLSLPSPEASFTMSGIADTRAILNEFKASMESIPEFMNVKIPVTSIDKKTNIPFTVSFQLKDPQLLYWQ